MKELTKIVTIRMREELYEKVEEQDGKNEKDRQNLLESLLNWDQKLR